VDLPHSRDVTRLLFAKVHAGEGSHAWC